MQLSLCACGRRPASTSQVEEGRRGAQLSVCARDRHPASTSTCDCTIEASKDAQEHPDQHIGPAMTAAKAARRRRGGGTCACACAACARGGPGGGAGVRTEISDEVNGGYGNRHVRGDNSLIRG